MPKKKAKNRQRIEKKTEGSVFCDLDELLPEFAGLIAVAVCISIPVVAVVFLGR